MAKRSRNLTARLSPGEKSAALAAVQLIVVRPRLCYKRIKRYRPQARPRTTGRVCHDI